MSSLGRFDETPNDDEDVLCASDAQFRLRDMLIDEISYVDRAANKRRFLLVKRAPGSGEAMGDKTQVGDESTTSAPQTLDDQTKSTVLSLTSETKNSLAAGLASALGHMVEVAAAVKSAEAPVGSNQACLPVGLGKQLRSAVGTVLRLLSTHIFKQDSKQVVEALLQVADTCAMLAEQASEEGADLMEVCAHTEQMAELLVAVAGRCRDTSQTAEDAQDDDKPADTEEPADEPKDAEKSKGSDIAQLTAAVTSLVEHLKQTVVFDADSGTQKAADDAQTTSAQAKLADEIAKRLAELEKANAVLKAKLEKALEEPPQRASSSTPTHKAAQGSGRVIFPLVYNNDVHDPSQGE